jgi:hypothetical protein
MLLRNTLCYFLSASLISAQATVYLIRHGEKPSSGNGLNAMGMQRAQCLRTVFGASSPYNIGHIMAETPQSGLFSVPFFPTYHFEPNIFSDGSQARPYDTVLPLSEDLGLIVDTSCQRDDSACVQNVVDSYTGAGNILICWEHDALTNIVQQLGDQNAPTYPSDQ